MPRDPALSFSNNPAFEQLIKALPGADSITIFCGAGVSIDAGLASWPELVSRIGLRQAEHGNQLARLVLASPTDLQRKAGILLRDRHGTSRLPNYAAIAAALYEDIEENRQSALARNIARFALLNAMRVAIVTTNFDDIMEIALKNIGFPDVRICTLETEAAWWQRFYEPVEPEFNLFHLHGYLGRSDQRGPLILTEDQYLEHGANVRQQIKAVFDDSDIVILVGVSLTDPNLIGPLSERGSNENVFSLSVADCVQGLTKDQSNDYYEELESYLETAFKIRVVRLSSYLQMAETFVELEAACYSHGEYLSSDQDTSIRYGYRLARSLKRAYEAVGFPIGSEPDFDALNHASGLLHNQIPIVKQRLLDLLGHQASSTLRVMQDPWDKAKSSLRNHVLSEGLALFLWLPPLFDFTDETRGRDLSLRLIACSAHVHREYWSFERLVRIGSTEKGTAARVVFTGRSLFEPDDPGRDPWLWSANMTVPLSLTDPISDLPVSVGALTLATQRDLNPAEPLDRSALALLDPVRRAEFLQFLTDQGSRLLT